MNKIAFDFDGSVADIYTILEININKLGYNWSMKDNKSHKIKVDGLNDAQLGSLIGDICNNNTLDAKPYDGVVKVLNMFYKNGNSPITVITARPEHNKDIVLKWFKKYIPNIKVEVHCCGDNGNKIPFLENKFKYYVEDRLSNAIKISECINGVFLINRSWNYGRSINHNIYRCDDFFDVYNMYLELEESIF